MAASRGMLGMGSVLRGALLAAVVLGAPAGAAEEQSESSPYYDTGRFYFYFETGDRFMIDHKMVYDVRFDPNSFDLVLGGGAGYNISDHWGIEFQAHGSEIDVRSNSLGKLEEYSNITLIPAVRFRWPLRDRRLVPFLTAGLGYSINDDNDQHDPQVKMDASDSTIAGSIAAGLEYFVNPNVAVGFSLHSFIYPDQDATITQRNASNQIVLQQTSSFNQSSLALLAHVRMFPGQPGQPGNMSLRRLLLADHGPFDTDARRVYLYALGGITAMFDNDFGGGVELKSPGDFNATLGAGAGVNLDRHWGIEAQFFNVAPNVNASPYGKFSEIDNITVLLLGRFRWPFLGGRLVPYATAGIGAGTFDLNDSRSVVDIPTTQGTAVTARTPSLAVQATCVAGQAGVGVEYFLNHYLSFGLAVPVYIYPDLHTRIQYPGQAPVGGRANFSGIAPQLQVKAYLN